MTPSHGFQVGDRVRTIRKHGDLPKRSNGIIIRVFEAADCSARLAPMSRPQNGENKVNRAG